MLRLRLASLLIEGLTKKTKNKWLSAGSLSDSCRMSVSSWQKRAVERDDLLKLFVVCSAVDGEVEAVLLVLCKCQKKESSHPGYDKSLLSVLLQKH